MKELAQAVCFIVSIVLLIPTVYQIFHSKMEAIWIYVNMAIGWIAGIVFYAIVLFTDVPIGHDWSANLRLLQYLCFGGWVFFVAMENCCKGIKIPSLKETRTYKWLKNLKQQ